MDLEVRRQIVHAGGIFTILLIQVIGRFLSALIVLGVATVFWLAAYYRINKKKINPGIIPREFEKLEAITRRFERPKEFPMKGAITFYLGTFLAIALFDQSIAIATIIVLALSDSFSTLIGWFYGKHKLPINKSKSWEGSITFFISTLAILLLFFNPFKALLVSIAGTFTEMLPKIDDNIAIPLVIGILLSLA